MKNQGINKEEKVNRKIEQIKAFIETISVKIEACKTKRATTSLVLMLEKSHFPLVYHSNSRSYSASQSVVPQLYDPKRAERVAGNKHKTISESVKTVTELKYYEIRLGDAKALLETFKKSLKIVSMKSVEAYQEEIKELELNYKKLSSADIKSKVGLEAQKDILSVRKLMRGCEDRIKEDNTRSVGKYSKK